MTAVFAAYGIKNEYKRDGVLTREGKIAIVGTFLSAVLSLSAQAIESLHQFRSERQQAAAYTTELERWNAILSDVNRGLYPVNDFHVEANVQLSLSRTPLRTYAERLRLEIKNRNTDYHNGFAKGSPLNGKGYGGWIASNSPAYPQSGKEAGADSAVKHLTLWFYFVKKPLDGYYFEPMNGSEGMFRAIPDPANPPTILFDSRCPDTVQLHLQFSKFDQFQMNQRVRFLEDFSGVEMLIQPDTSDSTQQVVLSPSQLSIVNLTISFGNKVHVVNGDLLRPIKLPFNSPIEEYFEYKLPNDMVQAPLTLPDTKPDMPTSQGLCPALDKAF